MSRRIANLLDKPEREIHKVLALLENKNGYPSHDARHIADNIQSVRRKVSELGLDPDDTTAKELYHALQARFEADSIKFDIANSFHSADFLDKAAKATKIVSAGLAMPERWVLKTTAAKSLLKQNAPKRLMKLLSYRSMDSMLKREDTKRLFIMANMAESAAWKKEMAKQVAKLDSTAFELRRVSLCSIDDSEIGSDTPLVYNDELGVLALIQNSAELITLLGVCILMEDFLSSLNNQTQQKPANHLLNWWSGCGHLLADLEGGVISLNVKDAGLNHGHGLDFSERLSVAGRTAFWKHLLNRYENQLAIEEDTMISELDQMLPIKGPIRQPAFEYEYAEDF